MHHQKISVVEFLRTRLVEKYGSSGMFHPFYCIKRFQIGVVINRRSIEVQDEVLREVSRPGGM